MGGFHLFHLPDGALSVPLPLKASSTSDSLIPSDFVVPTGHHAREDETPVYPLQIKELPVDILEIIGPSGKELRDKGKSDGLTKVIVLVQTAWFVAQCIARGIQHLPLTELEVVTLAYAMMNFFIYIFWWDKPRNIECPIRVYRTPTASHEQDNDIQELDAGKVAKPFLRFLFYMIGGQDTYVDVCQRTTVPMFWSGRLDGDLVAWASLGPATLGVAFGAIHCIAWVLEFPTHAELLLWRISSIAMIVVPLITALFCIVGIIIGKWSEVSIWELVAALLFILLIPSALLYIAGRIATLVIAFTTLRHLPSGAFSNVNWTTFIPHI